ncbi:Bug family tripartite tricarboxylate transporter substrate binding protein [Ramlibacter sp.]|uniref:Bug family tripartite tricarboxylate transporter substrate binding protein n=1 Tax=Ramlibacter sp. TaxID=1917967 RepID=UPI003D152E79
MPSHAKRLTNHLIAAVLLGAALLPGAFAQAYPDRPVTIVVPFPPGGSMDALARIAGQKLSATWGKPVVVDNRAGAGGMIGAQRVKGSPADGYTLLLTNSALIQNVVGAGAANAPYDPIKDFQPVMHMTLAPVVYAINPKLPAKTLQEFVALVKREPKKHSFGSGGVNQTLHLMGAVFNESAGLDMAHVAFKGDAALANDIIAGHISSGFVTIATAGPQIAAGNLRPLAVAGPRSPLLPDVPSFRELGFTQLDVVGWFGMFAPAGTPRAVVDKLAADIGAVLKQPDVATKLKEMALTPTGLEPAEFGRIVQRDLGYWDTVVKKVGEK